MNVSSIRTTAVLMRLALVIAILATGTVVVAAPSSAQGQSLTAAGGQDLTFGALIVGIPVSVTRFDRANTGQFTLTGARRAEVIVDLTLPTALVSARGDLLPIEFGSGDGGYSQARATRSARAFDPRVPLVTPLGNNGRLYIFLGGTVRPSAQQPAGIYRAAVTLTVSYSGV